MWAWSRARQKGLLLVVVIGFVGLFRAMSGGGEEEGLLPTLAMKEDAHKQMIQNAVAAEKNPKGSARSSMVPTRAFFATCRGGAMGGGRSPTKV